MGVGTIEGKGERGAYLAEHIGVLRQTVGYSAMGIGDDATLVA